MPKISLADLEMLKEQEDEFEFEDRRERVREKEAKSRFKENIDRRNDE